VVFATFSAFCNVNLRWGDRTFHFALYLRHLEDRPFHVTWCLQDFANDMCSVFEFQPSILHGKFPFWLILEALCNLVNQLIYIMVFTPTQGNKRGQKRNNWRGAWGGGRSASRKERRTKLRLCSSFAVVVVLVFHGSCCFDLGQLLVRPHNNLSYFILFLIWPYHNISQYAKPSLHALFTIPEWKGPGSIGKISGRVHGRGLRLVVPSLGLEDFPFSIAEAG